MTPHIRSPGLPTLERGAAASEVPPCIGDPDDVGFRRRKKKTIFQERNRMFDSNTTAPVIACKLPALTDSIPERKRGELAGEVTRELQVVGKAASIAIQTWVRNNDKTKARAEEREKNIGWIGHLFTQAQNYSSHGMVHGG